MNKIIRVLFIGLVTGLGIFVIHNIIQLTVSALVPSISFWGDNTLLRTLTLGLLFDMITGLAYSAAFAPVQWGLPTNRINRGLLLALVIVLIRVIPETLMLYNFFSRDLTLVLVSGGSSLITALGAGLFISALYPFRNVPRAGGNTD
ncbi:MAG: hypothetical protein GY771_16525 [bacterium]|nr:hypothetical protein [bacterium]